MHPKGILYPLFWIVLCQFGFVPGGRWSSWGPCSVTCGKGLQERYFCARPRHVSCDSSNRRRLKQTRQCVKSSCKTSSTLSTSELLSTSAQVKSTPFMVLSYSSGVSSLTALHTGSAESFSPSPTSSETATPSLSHKSSPFSITSTSTQLSTSLLPTTSITPTKVSPSQTSAPSSSSPTPFPEFFSPSPTLQETAKNSPSQKSSSYLITSASTRLSTSLFPTTSIMPTKVLPTSTLSSSPTSSPTPLPEIVSPSPVIFPTLSKTATTSPSQKASSFSITSTSTPLSTSIFPTTSITPTKPSPTSTLSSSKASSPNPLPGPDKYNAYFSNQKDVALFNSVIKVLNLRTSLQCAFACIRIQSCQSFNFCSTNVDQQLDGRGTCQINAQSHLTSPIDMTVKRGCFYSLRVSDPPHDIGDFIT